MPDNQRCGCDTFCRHQLRMSALLEGPYSRLDLQNPVPISTIAACACWPNT